MIVVIIAGGSGTRLWPLSTPNYPKHLLTVDGSDNSLLQSTYARAKRLAEYVYVVSESGHIEHVKQQLPDLPDDRFIVEPARRGTANCILAALTQISRSHDADEPIAFTHSDHFIKNTEGFVASMRLACQVSEEHRAIVLIGIEPDYPATIFGYIQKSDVADEAGSACHVKSFHEKPNFEVAKNYLESGDYLWNCGYFVGSINSFKAKMKQYAPGLMQSYQALAATTSAEAYRQTYLDLESDAIDYALIEKVPDLLVVPASFDWMDLGSFGDLHKTIESDQSGNALKGMVSVEDVANSYVQNEEEKPLIVIGLDGVVVVNTPHGILVSHKDQAHKVGGVSKRLTQP